jgi:hypothetical protein
MPRRMKGCRFVDGGVLTGGGRIQSLLQHDQ